MNNSKRIPLLAGNWKMHKSVAESVAFVRELKSVCEENPSREVLVCPPYLSLVSVREVLSGTHLHLGAQDLFWEMQGAYTGEVSGWMLKEAGCEYVIVGHSERRQFFSETDEMVQKKMRAAFKFGLVPIVCVGETLQERESKKHFSIVEAQLRKGTCGLSQPESERLVVAYEPVWAIGTGKTATPNEAQEMHHLIRGILAELYGSAGSEKVRILYGGSIKPENIDSLMAQPDIDGGLVGGASLKVSDFTRIIQYHV